MTDDCWAKVDDEFIQLALSPFDSDIEMTAEMAEHVWEHVKESNA